MSPEQCKTVRVQAWSPDQGDFVEINETDFDEKIHKLYEMAMPPAPPSQAAMTKTQKKAADKAAAEAAKTKFASEEAGQMFVDAGLTDDDQIVGSGKNGGITVDDIQKYIDEKGDK